MFRLNRGHGGLYMGWGRLWAARGGSGELRGAASGGCANVPAHAGEAAAASPSTLTTQLRPRMRRPDANRLGGQETRDPLHHVTAPSARHKRALVLSTCSLRYPGQSIGDALPALISWAPLGGPQRTRRRAGRGLVLCLHGVTHSHGVQTSRGSGQRSTVALLPNVPALGRAGP